jgi:hypothetical protein
MMEILPSQEWLHVGEISTFILHNPITRNVKLVCVFVLKVLYTCSATITTVLYNMVIRK